MRDKRNRSLIVLGVVSLLFVVTLTMFSRSNNAEPVSATADLSAEEITNDSYNYNNHTDNSSGDSKTQNNIDNIIDAEDSSVVNLIENHSSSHTAEITNTVENQIEGHSSDIENSIENHVNTGEEHSVENTVTNQVDVNVSVTVSNQITNDVSGTSSREDADTGEENGNGQGSNDNGDGEDQDSNGNGNGNNDEETPETVWGVDSASLTTDELLACVRDNFGDPAVWGRYLLTNEGVSYGLTDEEIELLHSNDIEILVIWNHFTDGTGYENGQNEANEAVEAARDLGIPEEVALFANVEPIYPIDSDFIQGWHDVVSESEYSSGIYGIFDPNEELYVAFEAAVDADSSILEEMYVWTAAPNEGITTEENAPEYNPEYPDGALIAGWQYGIDAETCNIDTNLFDGNVLNVLWE